MAEQFDPETLGEWIIFWLVVGWWLYPLVFVITAVSWMGNKFKNRKPDVPSSEVKK